MLPILALFALMSSLAVAAGPRGHGCKPHFPPYFKPCKGVCVNTKTDAAHCGNCRTKCPDGYTCSDGVCVEPPPSNGCQTPSQCDTGTGGDFTYCKGGESGQPFCFCAGKGLCLMYIDCNEVCTSDADCTTDDGGVCVPEGCCTDGIPEVQSKCGYKSNFCTNTLAGRNVFSEPGPPLRWIAKK